MLLRLESVTDGVAVVLREEYIGRMQPREIELDPVDFITVGTIGPKGRRVFHLQAGKGRQLVTVIIEKQQAQALSEAVGEMLDDLSNKYQVAPIAEVDLSRWDMSLRDPVQPLFRVGQMGLGYDAERDLVVLVAQELVVEDEQLEVPDPRVIRLWATREQVRALAEHARNVVKQGRADPRTNGHLIYYWT
jgi:uncharacterized repeat protein (TIGR03847 family)